MSAGGKVRKLISLCSSSSSPLDSAVRCWFGLTQGARSDLLVRLVGVDQLAVVLCHLRRLVPLGAGHATREEVHCAVTFGSANRWKSAVAARRKHGAHRHACAADRAHCCTRCRDLPSVDRVNSEPNGQPIKGSTGQYVLPSFTLLHRFARAHAVVGNCAHINCATY